jgi:hypothetical protein
MHPFSVLRVGVDVDEALLDEHDSIPPRTRADRQCNKSRALHCSALSHILFTNN